MRVRLEPSADVAGSWVVADVGLAYGGVAPKSIMADKVRWQAMKAGRVAFLPSSQGKAVLAMLSCFKACLAAHSA
jgi:hypothetical protein